MGSMRLSRNEVVESRGLALCRAKFVLDPNDHRRGRSIRARELGQAAFFGMTHGSELPT